MRKQLEYKLLKTLFPSLPSESPLDASASPTPESKVELYFGSGSLKKMADKSVLDFGCGTGSETLYFARQNCKKVVGLDIRASVIETGRARAAREGLQERCTFSQHLNDDEFFDIIVSNDAFEHYSDPAEVLKIMSAHLSHQGEIWISFGPPWRHPHGGHLFSVFPWAHLLFSEAALIQWRSSFKTDGATRFSEVEGGLNQLTIRKFEKVTQSSGLHIAEMKLVTIKNLDFLSNPFTREFLTSVVVCKLKKSAV